ncbi:cadherin-like beta sandwich domain-containing protein [Clostridium cellulovorans]|uniref:Fibronectin type-III domain-containing protein n=1 Tax=Clostridium cellulovorans (strain ATCC 35296 / DSM 3052 / OCM 3 / 743B) TaxID=573061 RepID=D9SMM7_CLOC7|nr:cadherin-like beta sandwich domain-containing protein [Clostridium cellulovorans]ADL49812.1 hypothetical protein Clocel_0022 [Clostridium cellulovorans 743B]
MRRRKRKRILAEFLALTLLINMFFTGVTQEIAYAASGTITFNTTDGTSMGSLLLDGQWNSTDISGIDLKFFNANNASDATNEVLAGGFIYSVDYSGIVAMDASTGTQYQYTVIKAGNGSKFSLNAIYLNDWVGGMGATIECYDGNMFLGSDNINADGGILFHTSSVSNPSKYQAITEIRISNSSDVTYGNPVAINNISIGDPIIPNAAPILNPISPTMPNITEDSTISGGQVISSFIGTSITDSDVGAKKGIAIISTDNQNGAWQYSVDGIFWNGISSVSNTSALLLRVEDKVRFVPNGKNGSSSPAKITYKAWDQTYGTDGSRADCSLSGGSSAFSVNSDTVSLNITNVNDAPVLTTGHNFTSISESDINNPGNSVADIAGTSITDVDINSAKGIAINSSNNGNGVWQYSIDGGSNWTNIDVVNSANSLLLRDIDRVRFVPNGMKGTTASITYRAWDTTTGTYGIKQSSAAYGGSTAFSSATNSASISVSNINYPPTLTSVNDLNGVDKTNTITYADLSAAADEVDSDGDTISFRIEALNTGTLRKNGNLSVTAGVTTIGPGESLSWTVPNNTNGLLNAFTIKAYDGTVASNTAVQVKVNVQDTTKPVINLVDRPSDGAYVVGNTLVFSIHSTENLYLTQNGVGVPYLDVKLGVNIVRAYYVSGAGTSTLTFVYNVVDGDYSGLNETIITPKVQVNDYFIKDIAGNNLVVDFAACDLSQVKVDTLAPTWAASYPKTNIITSSSIEVAMKTADELGTAYYVCLPSGSMEPTLAQVVAGQDAVGNLLQSNLKGYTAINKISDTFFNVDSLAPVTDYDIYIVAVDSLGNAKKTVTSAKTKSIPITDLSPSSKTANTVTLTWTSAIGASGIIIEQSLVSLEDWVPATTGPLALSADTAKIIGLVANTDYKFRVVVIGGVNEGISNAVTVATDELPLVTSVTGPSNGTYKEGDILNFIVTYDKNVTILGGTPSLNLIIGSNTREATYKSGSGSGVLSFSYTIQAGDLDTDGITLASNNISLNSSVIRNNYDEDASLVLNGVANFSGVLIDGVAPTVTTVSLPASTTYKAGDQIYVIANFDKCVFIMPGSSGIPYIELTVGAKKIRAYYYSGSGSQNIKFACTVASGNFDGDGIDIGTTIASNTGVIKDYAGNEAVYTYSSVDSSGLLVDAVAPIFKGAVISTDKKSITLTFDEDITSKVADLGSQISLSSDGGANWIMFNSLANKDAMTISEKDLILTFNSPLIGSKNKISILQNTIKDLFENIKTSNTETGNLGSSIEAKEDAALVEDKLDGRVINLAITGDNFKNNDLDKTNFILNNVPKGVTIKTVGYIDSTHCLVILSYDGSDFDADINNLSITVDTSELVGSPSIVTNNMIVTAINDDEKISIKNSSTIKEGAEDQTIITVTLTGGQFADTLNESNWTVSNLPLGVNKGVVTRVDSHTVEITLVGNTTEDYDNDITNVSVTCTSSEYTDSTSGNSLVANTGVVLSAKTAAIVITNPVTELGKTSVRLNGNITSSGNAIIKEKGFLYIEQKDPVEVKKVVSTEDSIGEYSTTLSNLIPNTVYEARAYVENEEGIWYGDVISFTTMPYSTNAKLKNIETNSGTLSPIFNSETKAYTAIVEYDVDNITVVPTVEDTGLAAIKVNDISVDSGKPSQDISLKTDKNTITILVTAEDGITTDTYTLDVYKKLQPILVEGKIIDKDGNNVDKAKVTVRPELDGTYTVEVKSNEALLIKTASGTKTTIKDYSKLKFISTSGPEGSISGDGNIKFSSLEKGKTYEYNAICKVGNSEIVIGKIKVQISDSGNVEVISDLIDPYGTITDATSGKVIDGVSVVLFYSDTARNRVAGIEPNTEVLLPIIDGFAPNDNKNPQISDSFGSYAFMVYPNTDYYIVATKDGYEKYISPTISIEKEIKKWDFKMNPIVPSKPTKPSTPVSTDKETVIPATGSPIDTKVLVIVGIVFVVAGFAISKKKKSNKK